jgi:hypothetical protein
VWAARVGRTLLSAAFEFDFDLSLIFQKNQSCHPDRSAAQQAQWRDLLFLAGIGN